MNGDGTYDNGEPFTSTIADDPSTLVNETGMYFLNNLPAGTYQIREVVPFGRSQTFPTTSAHQVIVTSGSTSLPKDFGNRRCHWWDCEKILPNPLVDVALPPILKDISIDRNRGTSAFPFIGPFYPYPQVPLGVADGIAVIGADNAHGVWQYSTNDGMMWKTFVGVSPKSAVVLRAGPMNRVRFVPMPGFAGVVSPGLTYRFAENLGFAILSDIEAFVDASQGGGDLPFSAEIGIASMPSTAMKRSSCCEQRIRLASRSTP